MGEVTSRNIVIPLRARAVDRRRRRVDVRRDRERFIAMLVRGSRQLGDDGPEAA